MLVGSEPCGYRQVFSSKDIQNPGTGREQEGTCRVQRDVRWPALESQVPLCSQPVRCPQMNYTIWACRVDGDISIISRGEVQPDNAAMLLAQCLVPAEASFHSHL